jgi:hypothetical protein
MRSVNGLDWAYDFMILHPAWRLGAFLFSKSLLVLDHVESVYSGSSIAFADPFRCSVM